MSIKNIIYTTQNINHHHLQHNQYQSYHVASYQMMFQDQQDTIGLLKNQIIKKQSNYQKNTLLQQMYFDQEIKVLKQRQNQLLMSLNKTVTQYGQLYKEYLTLIQNQSQQIQDQYDRAQANIYFLQNQIKRLTQICKTQNIQKQALLKRIWDFNQKRKQLKQSFDTESLILNKMIKTNKRKQQQIKIQRQIYLKLQQQMFDFDIKSQNLQKYGYEQIPSQLLQFTKQKQQIKLKIIQLNDRIQIQNKQINKMIKKQIFNKIQNQIRNYKQNIQISLRLKQENCLIKNINKQLQDVQRICQCNPNHQINYLENNIREITSKIIQIEKQNLNLNKKNNQVIKKIQYINRKNQGKKQLNYKNLKIQNKNQDCNLMKNKYKQPINRDKQNKSKLFNEIKHDLQLKTQGISPLKQRKQNKNSKANNNGIIWINDNEFKIKIKSKKLKLVYMTIILIIFAILTCKK